MSGIYWDKSRIVSLIAFAIIFILLGSVQPKEFIAILAVSALFGVICIWFCELIAGAWGYCSRGGGYLGPTSSTGVWLVGWIMLIVPALVILIMNLSKLSGVFNSG